MTDAAPPPQVPLCLAMILADNLHRDLGSGKMYILGTFANLVSETFPAKHPLIAVYLLLTDGMGRTPFTLKLLRTSSDEELKAVDGEVDFADPRMVQELGLFLIDVEFPAAGEYRIQLFCGSEFIIERRIVALAADADDEAEQDR